MSAGTITFLELRTDAVLSSIRVLNQLLEVALLALGVEEGLRHDLALGVAELVANVCEHEYADHEGGEVSLRLDTRGDALELGIRSSGPRFDFDATLAKAQAHDPLEDLDGCGLGLPMLVAMFDEIAHSYEEGQGNLITLRKSLA